MTAISSRRPSLSHRLQFALLVALFHSLRILPRQLRGAFGEGLGRIAYATGIRRAVVFQNLLTAFPGLPLPGCVATAKACFAHFGRLATSLAALPGLDKNTVEDWVLFEGIEELDRAVAEGKGGLVISGHLGNWEVVGAACGKLGYPVSFVVTTQRNKLVEAWLNDLRRNCGVEIIGRRDALKGVLSALKRNRLVAILIDQDAHEEGVFVPFFGVPSSTPRGPAVFHQRTGAPLIFMSSERIAGERYRAFLERVEVPEQAEHNEIMSILSAKLETAIRRTPEQWFWMHKRWKTSPPAS